MAEQHRELISIITPVYNEEENLDEYRRQITNLMSQVSDHYDVEVVITDNCSTDKSFAKMREWSSADPRVRAYRFSRNFGYQRSIFTGYSLAKGDAAIELDADLQDPPQLIPVFLKKREEGYKIVYGVRVNRPEGFVITKLRQAFYRFLRMISEDDLPTDAGDFMLLDRAVLDQLRAIYDPKIYIRGVVFGFGFRRIGIPYSRDARVAGATKFPFRKMASLAFDGIVGQSVLPLRIASYLGLVVACGTALLSLIYVILRAFTRVSMPLGFTTLVVLILFSASMNAVFLGIIGGFSRNEPWCGCRWN
jgi:dolichol-phosphate mannosyltransferase